MPDSTITRDQFDKALRTGSIAILSRDGSPMVLVKALANLTFTSPNGRVILKVGESARVHVAEAIPAERKVREPRSVWEILSEDD